MTKEEIIEHNSKIALRYGPRPTWEALSEFRHGYFARCPSGRHVLKVGLGFQGVGSAWYKVEWEKLTPEFVSSLPIEECTGMFSCEDL